MTMFRSTRGASKQRRDLINHEISHLRDLLPLPESARQRLSQLQIMSLCCCYIRKCNYFSRMFGNGGSFVSETPFQFSQAINGFLLITTREGKLLYISENITEYLGHSMVDMMTQGDSLYDIIDKRDHAAVQTQLLQPEISTTSPPAQPSQPADEGKTFFCRMNVARSFRRQSGFGDHKMMHVRGHFIQPVLRDHYGNQPVFMAICSPLVTPDMKEAGLQNNTMIYHSVHGLDLKFMEIGHVGEHHLGYSENEIFGKSLYEFLHPEDITEAKEKHVQLIKSSHEMGCMMTVRLQNSAGYWVWVNMVMHVRQPFVCDNGDPAIVCINHVINESEAQHFKVQSQLFSSHIAPSPEYLGQSSSPPHTITQVAVEAEQYPMSNSFMGALQSQTPEEAAMYFGEIGLTVAPAEDISSIGSGGLGSSSMEGIYLNLQSKGPSTFDQCHDTEAEIPRAQEAPKKIQRNDILNKLKRKMTEHAQQQCRPAKRPCVPASPDNSKGRGTGVENPLLPQMSFSASLLAAPASFDFGSLDLGDVQVMGAVGHPTIFANPKAEVKIEPPAPIPLRDMQPLTPPTPTSICSETADHMTSLSVEVDLHDTAVVPSSILTPDASPVASPQQALSPSVDVKPQIPTVIEDLSLFDGVDMDVKPKPEPEPEVKGLPVLDLLSLENFLTAMESPKHQLMQKAPQITLTEDQLVKYVTESLKDYHGPANSLVGSGFMLVPNQAGSGVSGLLNSSASTPSNGDLMSELKQLTETFANSPSYGDDDLASSLFQ